MVATLVPCRVKVGALSGDGCGSRRQEARRRPRRVPNPFLSTPTWRPTLKLRPSEIRTRAQCQNQLRGRKHAVSASCRGGRAISCACANSMFFIHTDVRFLHLT